MAASKVYKLAMTVDPGMVKGRLMQDAWNLLFFAVFAIIVAILFNSKNNPLGYWLNLIVISVADIGFMITILIPGYLPLVPGIIGPAVWISAIIFSTIGFISYKERAQI